MGIQRQKVVRLVIFFKYKVLTKEYVFSVLKKKTNKKKQAVENCLRKTFLKSVRLKSLRWKKYKAEESELSERSRYVTTARILQAASQSMFVQGWSRQVQGQVSTCYDPEQSFSCFGLWNRIKQTRREREEELGKTSDYYNQCI